MKIVAFSLVIAFAIFSSSFFTRSHPGKASLHRSAKTTVSPPASFADKLHKTATAAKEFVNRKNFNDRYCFLIDMGLPSGQNRFFIYDMKKDTVTRSGPVAHGNCFEWWLEGRRYSNKVGSGCTSLGRYKIGQPYTGKFGYSYKLHGLDSSNSNAYERTVVLHSHSCIPENAVADEICQSNGCPTVSPALLTHLKFIINHSEKPVLLWIYD
jgi:hypothetical protein